MTSTTSQNCARPPPGSAGRMTFIPKAPVSTVNVRLDLRVVRARDCVLDRELMEVQGAGEKAMAILGGRIGQVDPQRDASVRQQPLRRDLIDRPGLSIVMQVDSDHGRVVKCTRGATKRLGWSARPGRLAVDRPVPPELPRTLAGL